MVAARRAAHDDQAEPVVDLGLVEPARRAAAARAPRAARLILAPIALLSVSGLAVGLMVIPGQNANTTDPYAASANAGPLGVSRNFSRPALTPTPSASTSEPAAAEATVEPSATPSVEASPTPVVAPAPAQPVAPAEAAPKAAAPETTAAPEPEPTPEPEPAPEPESEPTPDYTVLGAEAGTRWSTAGVNVRTGPGTGYDVLVTISQGAKVTITETTADGWRQVISSERAGWIKESFLTDKEPPKATSSGGGQAQAASGFSSAPCHTSSGIESGLTSRTVSVFRAVCGAFPNVSSYGGARGGGGYHGSGQALDVMVSGDAGWAIANWARANARQLGIVEVIYAQQIWTTQRAGDGWRWMSDRGSATANHYDHVHISVGG